MLLLILLVVVAMLGLGETAHQVSRHRKRVSAAEAKKIENSKSWAHREILKDFMALPEAHRPSLGIESALTALDTKYGINSLNWHFCHRSGHYSLPDLPSWKCYCVYSSTGRRWEELFDTCQVFPEYQELRDSMAGVRTALAEQEQAMKDREHAMVLAGIENDLNALSEITAALRAERDLIHDVTKEIA